jgi:hypothetical protein
VNYDIRDLVLAERRRQRLAWAARHMPVLGQIRSEFAAEQPFQGRHIAASLHITTEDGGATSSTASRWGRGSALRFQSPFRHATRYVLLLPPMALLYTLTMAKTSPPTSAT